MLSLSSASLYLYEINLLLEKKNEKQQGTWKRPDIRVDSIKCKPFPIHSNEYARVQEKEEVREIAAQQTEKINGMLTEDIVHLRSPLLAQAWDMKLMRQNLIRVSGGENLGQF